MALRVEDRLWTYEDYCALPEDGQRYEVIDGRLYVSPSPLTMHQILSKRIQFSLYTLEQQGQGFIFDAPMDLIMPGCTPVQPDLIFLDITQVGMMTEKNIQGVPLLLVEILSPSTASYDRVTKLNRYAASGVPLYWIVDGRSNSVELLELVDGHYRIQQALTLGDRFEFRGVEFVLDALFAPIPGAPPAES